MERRGRMGRVRAHEVVAVGEVQGDRLQAPVEELAGDGSKVVQGRERERERERARDREGE